MGEFEATGKNRDEKKEEGSEGKEAGDHRNRPTLRLAPD